jgi:DNA polymerase/3'-5' exonuclease PolX
MISASGRLNQQVAERLREAAELLEQQQANPFRVGAYRRAAETVAALDEDVATLLEREGIEGLDALAASDLCWLRRSRRWPHRPLTGEVATRDGLRTTRA